jgi:hypothetical protein
MRWKPRNLWVILIIPLVVFAWFRILARLKEMALGKGLSISAVQRWWWALTGFYALTFLLSVAALFVLLRLLGRRLRTYEIATLVGNIFIIWFLFLVAAITSDPASLPALASIGLANLHWWLDGIASLGIPLLLYMLFNAIDRSFGDKHGAGQPRSV